jgi:thiol-disulfide isomerase/thioredoxin
MSTLLKVDFDLKRGVATRITTESKSESQSNPWHNRYSVALATARTRDPAWIDSLDEETEGYFVATKRVDDLITRAGRARTVAACRAALDEARRMLTSQRAKTSVPEVQVMLDAAVERHDAEVEYELGNATNREKLYSMRPANWQTTDLDGKAYRLTDFRGKVVLMDFWYRGCGHCIKAMPKVKQIAANYAGRNVAVLGINQDRNDDDARFVIKTLGLSYPTLRDGDISTTYHVRLWPTFIVLDQTGRVASIHAGNSDELVEQISRAVDELLANPASEPPVPFSWRVLAVVGAVACVVAVVVYLVANRRGGIRNMTPQTPT